MILHCLGIENTGLTLKITNLGVEIYGDIRRVCGTVEKALYREEETGRLDHKQRIIPNQRSHPSALTQHRQSGPKRPIERIKQYHSE